MPRKTRPEPQEDSSTKVGWNRYKIIVSGLILFHLLAVALPPLAFQTLSVDGPSPLIGVVIKPFAGYGQFLHMDRGYAFFAPDPGPSHLIQVASTTGDGKLVEEMYPDRNNQWPRLLYHRHFMLSEYLHEAYWPPGPPDEMFETDPEAATLWEQRRGRYEFIRQSYIDHLKSVNEGRDVYVRRIEHGLPALSDYVNEPIELDDPRLYNVLLDQPIYSDEIAPRENAESTELIPSPAVAPTSKPTPQSLKDTKSPKSNPSQKPKQSSKVGVDNE